MNGNEQQQGRTVEVVLGEIRAIEAKLPGLREAEAAARSARSEADCALGNLKSEFTNLAGKYVDHFTLERVNPKMGVNVAA